MVFFRKLLSILSLKHGKLLSILMKFSRWKLVSNFICFHWFKAKKLENWRAGYGLSPPGSALLPVKWGHAMAATLGGLSISVVSSRASHPQCGACPVSFPSNHPPCARPGGELQAWGRYEEKHKRNGQQQCSQSSFIHYLRLFNDICLF